MKDFKLIIYALMLLSLIIGVLFNITFILRIHIILVMCYYILVMLNILVISSKNESEF